MNQGAFSVCFVHQADCLRPLRHPSVVCVCGGVGLGGSGAQPVPAGVCCTSGQLRVLQLSLFLYCYNCHCCISIALEGASAAVGHTQRPCLTAILTQMLLAIPTAQL